KPVEQAPQQDGQIVVAPDRSLRGLAGARCIVRVRPQEQAQHHAQRDTETAHHEGVLAGQVTGLAVTVQRESTRTFDVAVVERGADRVAESGSPVRRHPRRPGRVRYAEPLSSNRAMAPAYWQRREVVNLGPMLNERSVP